MKIPGIPYYKSDFNLSVAPEEFFSSLKRMTSRYSENPKDASEIPIEPTFDDLDSDYVAGSPFVGKVSENRFRIRRRPKAREIPPIVIGRLSSIGNKIEFTVFAHPAQVILDIVLYLIIYSLWSSQFGKFGAGGIVTLVAIHFILYFTAFVADAKKLDETLRIIGMNASPTQP